jgi:HEAT repeat protein
MNCFFAVFVIICPPPGFASPFARFAPVFLRRRRFFGHGFGLPGASGWWQCAGNPMRKRSIALLTLLAVGVVVAGWEMLRPREPSYNGKPLSYWIDPSARGGHETAAERSAALAAMSGTAVPYLVQRLRWKPSPIVQRLYKQFPRFVPLMIYEQGNLDPRGAAAHALGELGPLASNAIPDLTAASTTFDLNSSWYPRMCARAALIKIRQESLAPYIEKLKDTSYKGISSLMDWYENALMIGEFGTNGAAAVPNLILALGPTNNGVIQAHAIITLGEIHSVPEACVPAIIPFLRSPDIALRQKAVGALPQFGDAAKPAWADLTQCLNDTDPWTRIAAANALKRIDPISAAQAGVK